MPVISTHTKILTVICAQHSLCIKLYFKDSYRVCLNQPCPICRPQATCGPIERFVQTSELFIVMYVQMQCNDSQPTFILTILNSNFSMQWSLCLFIMYYALIYFHVYNDTSEQNWFLGFRFLLTCFSALNRFLTIPILFY